MMIRLGRSARHNRGTPQCALLTTGDTHAHKVQALLRQLTLAADRVWEMRVTAVNNNIALIQQGC